MNKELKISDKSPFEKIRKFDGQGRSYWTSRELCAALGYSTYQKFSVPLAKAMKSAEADGINGAGDHSLRDLKDIAFCDGIVGFVDTAAEESGQELDLLAV